MSELPKKIWIDDTILRKLGTVLCAESDIPYIRADLVGELVEALEHAAGLLEALGGTAYMARDALKKLEESDGHR